MAETWDLSDLLDDDEDQNQGPQKVDKNDPKSLRKFATSTARENAELKKQIAEIHAAARTRTIAEKLAEKKIPEKIAKLIPAEVSMDKIDTWLEEYKDVFTPPAGPEAGEGEEVDEQEDYERAAQDRMSVASGAAVPASRPTDQLAQIRDPNMTRDQLMKMIEGAGGGYGTG